MIQYCLTETQPRSKIHRHLMVTQFVSFVLTFLQIFLTQEGIKPMPVILMIKWRRNLILKRIHLSYHLHRRLSCHLIKVSDFKLKWLCLESLRIDRSNTVKNKTAMRDPSPTYQTNDVLKPQANSKLDEHFQTSYSSLYRTALVLLTLNIK